MGIEVYLKKMTISELETMRGICLMLAKLGDGRIEEFFSDLYHLTDKELSDRPV